MFCKIKDNQVTNISPEKGEGMLPISFPEVNYNDPDKAFVGWEYKAKRGRAAAVPVFIDRTPSERAKKRRELAESAAMVRYKDVAVRVHDMDILKLYIDEGYTRVNWKGHNDWLELTDVEMKELLSLMVEKKQELFDNELKESV